MKQRINIYIRDKTLELLKDYMKIEDFDMSTCVDILIRGRLEYLERAKAKAEEDAKKEAKKQQETYPEEKARLFKKEMGREPWTIEEAENWFTNEFLKKGRK